MTTQTISATQTKEAHAEIASVDVCASSILLWVFFIMSLLGFTGEYIQHYFEYHQWEPHPGYLWGPLSPIYGLAAVILTQLLAPIEHKKAIWLFLISALVGGGLEYFASWAMETAWNVRSWDYSLMPLNFNGRTCVFIMCVWGFLGLAWARLGLPLIRLGFSRVDLKSTVFRLLTCALTAFIIVDTVATAEVLLRAQARTEGLPPQNAIEVVIDDAYPTADLQARFPNMGGLGLTK